MGHCQDPELPPGALGRTHHLRALHSRRPAASSPRRSSRKSRPRPATCSRQLPDGIRRDQPPALPEVSQKHVLSHYLHLSQEVLGSNLCPDVSQGTCTMKYNPRGERGPGRRPQLRLPAPPAAGRDGPGHAWRSTGRSSRYCKELAGMDRFCLQPGGGAHAVFTAASIARAYHRDRGEAGKRDEIITTMFSHPCDAASPATAGLQGDHPDAAGDRLSGPGGVQGGPVGPGGLDPHHQPRGHRHLQPDHRPVHRRGPQARGPVLL